LRQWTDPAQTSVRQLFPDGGRRTYEYSEHQRQKHQVQPSTRQQPRILVNDRVDILLTLLPGDIGLSVCRAGSCLFEMVIIVVEGWFVRKGVSSVARQEGWSAFFSHETAFDLLNDVVSCHVVEWVSSIESCSEVRWMYQRVVC